LDNIIDFSVSENIFGFTVRGHSKNGDWNNIVVENESQNPLENFSETEIHGRIFRNPNTSLENLTETFRQLPKCLENKYSLKCWVHETKVYSLITVDEADAAMFYWKLSNIWENWSKNAEKEHWESVAESKSNKLIVDENGKVKVRVTVNTLNDS
jgi:hypothetical protein